MPFLRSCFLALLILVGAPLRAATGDPDWLYRGSDIPRDTAWTFGTLPNGLHYAVRHNDMPPGQVSIRVRIDAGSMNETDAERGWAHFVEHMAFRGNAEYADREARYLWEKLGASFGSDTNASTDATQTVYQLDLPHADRASLDQSLKIIAEMMDSARFEPEAVNAERNIVLAEKRRRSELATKLRDLSFPLFYAGLKYGERDPIGTDATLATATPEGLKAFYERWYRPDRATVIMVGDADPKMMEELIAAEFGDWRPSGPAPAPPDYGRIATPKDRTALLVYPGAPSISSLVWLRPYEAIPDTLAREEEDLARSLATRILNRRLAAKSRAGAAFLTAAIGANRATDVADITQMTITARDGRWKEALGEVFAILNDAVRQPPSEAEIAREIANLKMAGANAVTADPTVRSQQRAQQLVKAVDEHDVIASAAETEKLIEQFSPRMTPAVIEQAMRGLFEGAGPRLLQLTPDPVEGGDAAVAAALASAEKAAPAARPADRKVEMSELPPLGTPGEEVSRQSIPDMGVTIVRFANGSTLTFKQTDFEKGSVGVELRFGNGRSGFSPDRPSLEWLEGIVAGSGLADLDQDGLERLMTGRRMGIAFGIADDAFELGGTTNAADLKDELRLLATKLAFPRWDEKLFNRFKAGILESYDLSFGSASARTRREFPGFSHPGDARWAPVERQAIANTTAADFQAFYAPILAQGAVHAIIVGDVDLDTAVQAMKQTVAAIPSRPAPPPPRTAVAPPTPDPDPTTFTHSGDADQAEAVIGWSTLGGTDHVRERRALSFAANMFEARLFDRLREEEGATYSPNAASSASETFPDWGAFYAVAEIKPESTATFFRIARDIAADMATKPAGPDEFARVQNPIVSGIERALRTNGAWLKLLEDWVVRPELIGQTRTYLSDYKSLTPEEVRVAFARYVTDQGDWSMLVLPGRNKEETSAGGD